MASDANITNGLNNVSWMETIFHGFAQYSQIINKAVGGTLGGIASLFDLYSVYDTYQAQPGEQRKIKLLTYFASFSLNALYAVGAVLKILSTLALSILCVGIDLVALARISYITHQARKAVKNTKHEMEKFIDSYDHFNDNTRQQRAVFGSLVLRVETERKHRFQSKIEVGYTILSALTSCMFIGGLFFPPLYTVGFAALLSVKIIQFIDYRMDLALSRWANNVWNKISKNDKKTLIPDQNHYSQSKTTLKRTKPTLSPKMNTDFNRPNGLTAGFTRLFPDKPFKAAPKERYCNQAKKSYHYRKF